MKVLTCTPYKELFMIYAEINNSVTVNSFQIGLAGKGIMLLPDTAVVLCRAGSRAVLKIGM